MVVMMMLEPTTRPVSHQHTRSWMENPELTEPVHKQLHDTGYAGRPLLDSVRPDQPERPRLS